MLGFTFIRYYFKFNRWGSQPINDEEFYAEFETKIGESQILPPTTTQCFVLNDIFDTYFKSKCCSEYFIVQSEHDIDDGITLFDYIWIIIGIILFIIICIFVFVKCYNNNNTDSKKTKTAQYAQPPPLPADEDEDPDEDEKDIESVKPETIQTSGGEKPKNPNHLNDLIAFSAQPGEEKLRYVEAQNNNNNNDGTEYI